MRESRGWSFVIVTVIYILTAAVGAVLYYLAPGPFWARLLLADVGATVFVFLFSVALKNASVYDPYWSVQPIVILAAFAVQRGLTPLTALLLAAVTLWGARLTTNWAYTFHGLNFQDWRYTMLAEKTGRAYPIINFVGIHMVPTLVVYGCVLPAVFAFQYQPELTPGSVLFVLVSVLAFTMQGVADAEMHRFRRRRERGETGETFIQCGLWKHTRHPNYLGEILMWWGIALSVVCAMPQRWYLIAGAAANTLLFLLVSIPMADGRQSKKPGFAAYKQETWRLLPLPRRAARL